MTNLETLAKKMLARFRGIKTADGYDITMVRVFEDWQDDSSMPDNQFPFMYMLIDDERDIAPQQCSNYTLRIGVPWILIANDLVKEGRVRRTLLNTLHKTLIKAIYSPASGDEWFENAAAAGGTEIVSTRYYYGDTVVQVRMKIITWIEVDLKNP